MGQHIERVAGIDLGDTHCSVCIIDASSGEVLERSDVRTRGRALASFFGARERLRVALEVGTHSPWVSRMLEEAGHEVIVPNARAVRLIYGGKRKGDRLDAEKLARLTRVYRSAMPTSFTVAPRSTCRVSCRRRISRCCW